MRYLFIVSLIYVIMFTSSCCSPEREQPVHPGKVSGWKDTRYNDGGHSIAKLVLHKGESSDNGKIGVMVIDIIPADNCAHPGTYSGSPRAVIRFFAPSGLQATCETTFVGEKGNLIHASDCGSSFGLSGVNIYGINTKDGWVYFELFSSS